MSLHLHFVWCPDEGLGTVIRHAYEAGSVEEAAQSFAEDDGDGNADGSYDKGRALCVVDPEGTIHRVTVTCEMVPSYRVEVEATAAEPEPAPEAAPSLEWVRVTSTWARSGPAATPPPAPLGAVMRMVTKRESERPWILANRLGQAFSAADVIPWEPQEGERVKGPGVVGKLLEINRKVPMYLVQGPPDVWVTKVEPV